MWFIEGLAAADLPVQFRKMHLQAGCQRGGGKVFRAAQLLEADDVVDCLFMANESQRRQHPDLQLVCEEQRLLCIYLQHRRTT